jgi:hypothetical protein
MSADTVRDEGDRPVDDFEEAFERYARGRDVFRIDHTVQVTSFGGSGTTALCRRFIELEVDLQKGPGQWPHKHARRPPLAQEVPPGFRVVYVVGDPRDAVVSIFRRNYQLGHFRALHNREPSAQERERLASLDAFVAVGEDGFDLSGHLRGWRAHPPGYPVLFVKYDHLNAAWESILDFVGLPRGTHGLPARERVSDWRTLPASTRRQIDLIYGELASFIDSLPPVEVV